MHWLRHWWRQVDHYDWIMTYLKIRGLVGLVRALITAVTLSSGLVLTALISTSDGIVGRAAGLVAAAALVSIFLLGFIWAVSVPDRRQSQIFATGTTTCIGVLALSCSDPTTAILVSTLFAIPAGYIAFAHTAIYAAYNFQMAMIVATVEASRVAMAGHPVQGFFALWLILVLTLTIPASIQIIVHSLGIDLLQADSDPLTFVLNRRAFMLKTQELISRRRGADSYLVVMVIDLDGFKTLNDTLGHPAGDRALVTVAELLRAHTRDTATIGRSGGDEFLIADTTSRPDQTLAAERLRVAIADTSFPVTASIGIAATALIDVSDSAAESAIEDLVITADHQMYTAKRAGGNQIRRARIA